MRFFLTRSPICNRSGSCIHHSISFMKLFIEVPLARRLMHFEQPTGVVVLPQCTRETSEGPSAVE